VKLPVGIRLEDWRRKRQHAKEVNGNCTGFGVRFLLRDYRVRTLGRPENGPYESFHCLRAATFAL